MKNLKFLFVIYFGFYLNSKAETKDGYNIKVTIKGIKDTTCILANYYGDKQYIQDSARADKKGNMIFKGENKLPGGIYMIALPDKRYFEFVINEQDFTLETDTSDLIGRIKVKGSHENELFYQYIHTINPLGQQVDSLKKEYDKYKDNKDSIESLRGKIKIIEKRIEDFKKEIVKNNPETFVAKMLKAMGDIEVPEPPVNTDGKVDSFFKYYYLKEHFFDNIDFSDERILRTPVYHSKIKQYVQSWTIQIPDSINKAADFVIEKTRANPELFKYTVWWITHTYETSNLMGMDAVFVHLAEKYYTFDQAYWLDSATVYKIRARARILKPTLIGKVAPEIVMLDPEGQWKSLHSIKAKYTILVFWDPDCGHCKKEIPPLNEVYEKFKLLGVEAFAVCTEREKSKWLKFIEEKKLKWINVWDPNYQSDYRNLYDISSTPKIFLLNNKKEIVVKQLDPKQIEEFLEKMMKKNEPSSNN